MGNIYNIFLHNNLCLRQYKLLLSGAVKAAEWRLICMILLNIMVR